jgi:hypothetical protein
MISRIDVNEVDKKAELIAKVAEHKLDQDYLQTTIPSKWKVENGKFLKLQKAYKKARKNYRSAMDNGYIPIQRLLSVIDGTGELSVLRVEIAKLEQSIVSMTPKQAAAQISKISKLVGRIQGTKSIKSALTQTRREVRRKNPDFDKAQRSLVKTLKVFDKEIIWRQRAVEELLPNIKSYEGISRNTIGLRQLTKLPQEQALQVAKCNANHRDVSLSF